MSSKYQSSHLERKCCYDFGCEKYAHWGTDWMSAASGGSGKGQGDEEDSEHGR